MPKENYLFGTFIFFQLLIKLFHKCYLQVYDFKRVNILNLCMGANVDFFFFRTIADTLLTLLAQG